jgi:hypothetical protein
MAFFLLPLCFISCFNMFNENKTVLLEYKVDSVTNLEIYIVGHGATTKDVTKIEKDKSSIITIVKQIDYSYAGFKTELSRINDTLFRVTFVDTSTFKGRSKIYDININDQVVSHNSPGYF